MVYEELSVKTTWIDRTTGDNGTERITN